MNEALLPAFLIAAVIAAAIALRATSVNRHARALSRVEAKLDALLDYHGVQFDPYSDVPPAVIDALRRGQKVEAIRQYRLAAGAGLREAKEYVEAVQHRVS